MEAAAETRSGLCGPQQQQPNNHFSSEDLRRFMPPTPPDSATSFTALLELPPTQAVELLVHSTESLQTPPPPPPPPTSTAEGEVKMGAGSCGFSGFAPPLFPSNMELVGRAAKFSVFATPGNSPELKQEQIDSDFNFSDTTFQTPTNKRKGREKKVKESNKRNKKHVKETSEDEKNGSGEKLPYVHVRARRGQATDSHSLAERARREKINARMKLLQELVPGCNKISGTASVLDEIINHVQSLQRQVEFLSMRLAAVNPSIDVNLDAFMTAENGSHVESNYFTGITMPSVWPEEQIRPQYQQLWQLDGFQQSVWIKEEDNNNLVPP